jgi:hypothetical protein
LDPTLKSALAQPSVHLFGALKIELPEYTLRLVDGSGTIVIGGETYIGLDATFGAIAELSELTEEIGDSAPEITVALYPPDVTATAVLSHPDMQGSRATLMVGAVDPISGIAIGTPEILFMGEIDVPSIQIDQNGARKVEYTIVSVFERMFEVEEGQRASNGWHQSVWPGELGLDHMTGTDVNLYWGAKPPQGSGQKTGLAAALANSQAIRARLTA